MAIQTSLFDFIKPGDAKIYEKKLSTDDKLVGQSVMLSIFGREILAKIEGKDTVYPDTAYRISWTKKDNPRENISDDCAGIVTVMHFSNIRVVRVFRG